uniref:Sugar phosphate transporter domain-containing protein n=1 Tax=Alexandrium catenella TaxID=2925 RepID=A0A7S1RVB2_ALECA|mmetsp:Transcript_74428/g.197698  ORF Transcript_74428/g.197698 Transcript_74428/m.197698 type:complete len:316 (+) Transcript_74428:229-1176(+)
MSALLFGSFNLVASVSIILVNKQIVSVCGFHFILTVLFLNFLCTCTLLEVCAYIGYVEEKQLPVRDRCLLAAMAVLTVLLNNASNEANSVGFYQITKLLIIPTVIFIERFGGVVRSYSRGVICSLLVASVGVAVASVSDFEINTRGTILAFLSILVTAQYQVWQGSKQHEHGLSALQITHSVSRPQVAVALVATFLFDVRFPELKDWMLLRSGGLLDHRLRSQSDVYWIIGCCAIAVVMNISTYGLLGKASPVTYQVIGQVKTCLITILGYVFFDVKVPRTWLIVRFSGVGIAVIGIVTYAILKNGEQKKAKKAS